MRKADLINKIYKSIVETPTHDPNSQKPIEKIDVLFVMSHFFEEVKKSLIAGENIYVRGFGSFILKKRAHKVGRHIKAGKTVEIPAHYIPAFKPAKELAEKVKELPVAAEKAKSVKKTRSKTSKTIK
jgi:DNA-binding protein HU-beta